MLLLRVRADLADADLRILERAALRRFGGRCRESAAFGYAMPPTAPHRRGLPSTAGALSGALRVVVDFYVRVLGMQAVTSGGGRRALQLGGERPGQRPQSVPATVAKLWH